MEKRLAASLQARAAPFRGMRQRAKQSQLPGERQSVFPVETQHLASPPAEPGTQDTTAGPRTPGPLVAPNKAKPSQPGPAAMCARWPSERRKMLRLYRRDVINKARLLRGDGHDRPCGTRLGDCRPGDSSIQWRTISRSRPGRMMWADVVGAKESLCRRNASGRCGDVSLGS